MKKILLISIILINLFFYLPSKLLSQQLTEYFKLKNSVYQTLIQLNQIENKAFLTVAEKYISLFGYQKYLENKDKLIANLFDTYSLAKLFSPKINKKDFYKLLNVWKYQTPTKAISNFISQIDSYVNAFREPTDNYGNYRWATYQKIPGKIQKFSYYIHTIINSKYHKWQLMSATFYKTYLIKITEPRKRTTFRGNRDFYLYKVEVTYKNHDWKTSQTILKRYGKWFRRGEYVEIPLKEVYDTVEVKVWASTKPIHRGKSKLEIVAIQGKLVDLPQNPAYPLIQTLISLKKSRDYSKIKNLLNQILLFNPPLSLNNYSNYKKGNYSNPNIDYDIYIYRQEREKQKQKKNTIQTLPCQKEKVIISSQNKKANLYFLKKDLEYLYYLVEKKESYDKLKYELGKILKQDF